jgi:outer membrane protein OmpA-like peptidoglycan-associated protein
MISLVQAQEITPIDGVATGDTLSGGQSDELDTRISSIYFSSGKITPQKSSMEELYRVLRLLQMNPELKLFVQGHADFDGTIEQNEEISRLRAKYIRAFLIGKGIHHSRLKYAGFGLRRMLTPENTPEARQSNRRVEFHYME